jgi:uncharacterized protein (TIGR02145 family)
MKKLFSLIAAILILSCSTSSDDNGNSTSNVVPVPPTNLMGAAASPTQINLSWTDNSTNETGFKIDRKIGSSNWVTDYGIVSNADVINYSDTEVSAGITYTYRVSSFNSVGKSLTYSNEVTLTPIVAPVLPTVTTTAASSITQTTATSGGNISNDGGAAVTTRGVCWSTSTNPTIALTTKTTDGTGIGPFTSNMTGLAAGTTYYIRAYATNSVGTAYGNEVSFIAITPNYAAMYPAGTVFCDNVVTAVVDVTNPVTGKMWMDRNLGASQVATGITDANAYGDLYQWGRRADGHQCRTSAVTSTLSSTDQPSHGDFISTSNSAPPYDWRSPQNDNLWQGVNGINNPCPNGYRLPTEIEYINEFQSWSSGNQNGAFSSNLKFSAPGARNGGGGGLYQEGVFAMYWTSTVSSTEAKQLVISGGSFPNVNLQTSSRREGYTVRCIKN